MLNSLVRSPTGGTVLVKSESGAYTEFQAYLPVVDKENSTDHLEAVDGEKEIQQTLPSDNTNGILIFLGIEMHWKALALSRRFGKFLGSE
ncbi:MAG: hypothetical protein ACPGQV_13570 [Alphaproteobacteria bacterium]